MLYARVAEVLQLLQHYLQTLVKYLARQLRLLLSHRGANEVAGTHCRDVTHDLSLTILVGMIKFSPVHEANYMIMTHDRCNVKTPRDDQNLQFQVKTNSKLRSQNVKIRVLVHLIVCETKM